MLSMFQSSQPCCPTPVLYDACDDSINSDATVRRRLQEERQQEQRRAQQEEAQMTADIEEAVRYRVEETMASPEVATRIAERLQVPKQKTLRTGSAAERKEER